MTLVEALDRLIAVLGEPSGVWYGHKHAWGALWIREEGEITLDDSCCGGFECECSQLFLQAHDRSGESFKSYPVGVGCDDNEIDLFTPERAAEMALHFLDYSKSKPVQFSIGAESWEKIKKWMEQHEIEHPPARTAIGGRYRYSFCPTTIGTVITVECSCKTSFDATDYDSW